MTTIKVESVGCNVNCWAINTFYWELFQIWEGSKIERLRMEGGDDKEDTHGKVIRLL